MIRNIKVIKKDEGEFLGVAGDNYRVIVSSEDTGDNYSVVEMLVPPGGGPPPHSHAQIQEMFYIIEGELQFFTEDGVVLAGPGDFVNVPFGGAVHCFKNVSDKMAKMLCTVIPGGIDRMFRQIGAPSKQGEFLPIPPLTAERVALLQAVDKEFEQTTYPHDFLTSSK